MCQELLTSFHCVLSNTRKTTWQFYLRQVVLADFFVTGNRIITTAPTWLQCGVQSIPYQYPSPPHVPNFTALTQTVSSDTAHQ